MVEPLHFTPPSYNDSLKCIVYVDIKNIDVKNCIAQGDFKIWIFNTTCSYPTIKCLISGCKEPLEFYCSNSNSHLYIDGLDYHSFYEKEIKNVTWPLRSYGEFYPFDYYLMDINVQQVWIQLGPNNQTRFSCKIFRVNSRLSPEGDYNYLTNSWRNVDSYLHYYPFKTYETVRIRLESFGITQLTNILQILAPLLLIFLLIGSTFILEDNTRKTTVYLGLFTFITVFWFTIQNKLPYHIMLTLPEFLIANIIMILGILMFFSISNNKLSQYIATFLRVSKYTNVIPIFSSLIIYIIMYLFYYLTIFPKNVGSLQSLIVIWVIVISVSFILAPLTLRNHFDKKEKDPSIV